VGRFERRTWKLESLESHEAAIPKEAHLEGAIDRGDDAFGPAANQPAHHWLHRAIVHHASLDA
jgi:hypothetical protein